MSDEAALYRYARLKRMSPRALSSALRRVVHLADSKGQDIRPKVLPILARLEPQAARIFGISVQTFRRAYQDVHEARATGDADSANAALKRLRALQELEAERLGARLRTELPLRPAAADAAIERARRLLEEQ